MPLEAQTKWYFSQVDLSAECSKCGDPTEVSLDDELEAFTGECEHCGNLVMVVIRT